jgi:NAD dependent epimerase/dehydratase family enzyme
LLQLADLVELSWIHIRDVVRALIFALDHDSLAGAVNLVAPEPATMNAFARSLARALERPSLFRIPALALRVALGEGIAKLLLTGQRVVPRKLKDAGFVFEFPNLDQALRDLR